MGHFQASLYPMAKNKKHSYLRVNLANTSSRDVTDPRETGQVVKEVDLK